MLLAGTAVVEGVAALVRRVRPEEVRGGLETAAQPVPGRTHHQLLPVLTEAVLGGGQSYPATAVSALHLHLAEVGRDTVTRADSGPAHHSVL